VDREVRLATSSGRDRSLDQAADVSGRGISALLAITSFFAHNIERHAAPVKRAVQTSHSAHHTPKAVVRAAVERYSCAAAADSPPAPIPPYPLRATLPSGVPASRSGGANQLFPPLDPIRHETRKVHCPGC